MALWIPICLPNEAFAMTGYFISCLVEEQSQLLVPISLLHERDQYVRVHMECATTKKKKESFKNAAP